MFRRRSRPLVDFFQELIPDQEQLNAFAAWAFGEDFLEINGTINFMHKWNEIHGKELMLDPSSAIALDTPKMIMLWRASLA